MPGLLDSVLVTDASPGVLALWFALVDLGGVIDIAKHKTEGVANLGSPYLSQPR